MIEESVKAHLVADVGVSSFLERRPRLEHHHRARKAGESGHGLPTRSGSVSRISVSRPCPTTLLYARKVADKFGIPLHEIEIAPDIVDLLPRMVDILDEPIGDPAAINTLLMCEAARDRQG